MAIPLIAKAAEVANEAIIVAKEIDITAAVFEAETIIDELWPEAKEMTPFGNVELTPESIADEAWGTDVSEKLKQELDVTFKKYFDDIKDKSNVKDTLEDIQFDVTELRLLTPEENAMMREEFALKKNALKRQWEEMYNRSWPKYESDVYITNSCGESVLIRRTGMEYDAHHIQPLSFGGKNEAGNLTPLSADIHFDHKGIHKLGSPYDQMCKMLGGTEI